MSWFLSPEVTFLHYLPWSYPPEVRLLMLPFPKYLSWREFFWSKSHELLKQICGSDSTEFILLKDFYVISAWWSLWHNDDVELQAADIAFQWRQSLEFYVSAGEWQTQRSKVIFSSDMSHPIRYRIWVHVCGSLEGLISNYFKSWFLCDVICNLWVILVIIKGLEGRYLLGI